MAGEVIGEADIVIGADAKGLPQEVLKQSTAGMKAAGSKLAKDIAGSMGGNLAKQAKTVVQGALKQTQATAKAQAKSTGDAIGQGLGSGIQAATKQLSKLDKSLTATFRNGVREAKSLGGPIAAVASGASKSFEGARQGLRNFTSGFTDARKGLSSFTGNMGTLGVLTKNATNAAGAALRTLPNVGRSAFAGLRTAASGALQEISAGASKTLAALKSEAAKAAKAAGAALKDGIGGAAKGVSAIITGGVVGALAKGFARLNSLDQAKAKLDGLRLSAKAAASALESADAAVTGTAFSTADAASAAGVLATAGVKTGKQMDAALSSVVSVAAGAQAEIGEIAPLFAKVAAQGKVSGEVMQQFLERGINASGALQKSLGKTGDEIASMVSAGQIDFDTLTSALNSDLALLAASMGGTLQGMTTNVVSAFGRIGAEVQKPIFDGLLVAMPGVLEYARELATAVKEFMAPLQGTLEPLAQRIGDFFKNMNPDAAGIGAFADSMAAMLPILGAVAGSAAGLLSSLPVIGPMFAGISGPVLAAAGALAALTMVDPSTLTAGFENIAGFIADKLPAILGKVPGLIEGALSNLVANLPTLIGGVTTIIVQLIDQIAALLPELVPMLVQGLTQAIVALVQALLSALPQLLNAALQLFGSLVTALLQSLPMLVQTLVAAIPTLIQTLVDAVPMILDGALRMFLGILDALVVALPQVITALVEALPQIIGSLVSAIPQVITAAIDFFLGMVQGLVTALPQIIEALIGAIPQILQAIIGAIPQIIEAAIQLFLGLVTGLVEAIPMLLTAIIEMIPMIVGQLIELIPQLIEGAYQLFLGLVDGLIKAIPDLLEAISTDLMGGIWDAITGKGSTEKAKEAGRSVGSATVSGISSTATDAASAGSALAGSATSGMTASTASVTSAGSALGSSAVSGFSSSASGMSTAAADLGKTTVSGLESQTSAASSAASGLANAATVDVSKQAESAKTAGAKVAKSLASGMRSGSGSVRSAASALTSSATRGFSSASATAAGGRIGKAVVAGLNGTKASIAGAMRSALSAANTAAVAGTSRISATVSAMWTARVAPTLSAMRAGWATAFAQMRASMHAAASSIVTQTARITTAMSGVSRAVGKLPSAFAVAASGITAQWARIREAAARPARFVVNTVFGGLVSEMNKIPGVKVPKPVAGFARGGILPGMSRMSQGDDQLIMARRGEGMMVSEALRTRADRAAFLAANAAGRRGIGFASMLRGYARGGLITPLPRGSFSVSQPWGNAGHNGIDLAAAMGTKILAAADGIVRLASAVNMGGNEIYIDHLNGLATRYSHLSSFAVKVGQRVKKGNVIGRVGSTGMSTGPHLHYMVHNPAKGPGVYVPNSDPAPYMRGFVEATNAVSYELESVAKRLMSGFSSRFPAGSMWNDAAGSLMRQGVKQAVAAGEKLAGQDQGRTGRGIRPTLYDNGGWLRAGNGRAQVVQNKTGKPEAILTAEQWAKVGKLIDAILKQGATGGASLVSLGGDIGAGLAKGIASGTGVVGEATVGLADTVLGTMRSEMDIHSPSREMKKLGKFIGQGLIKGITGTYSQTKSAIKKLTDLISDAFSSAARTNLMQRIKPQLAALKDIAKQSDKIAAKLKDAKTDVKDLRQARADYAADVTSSVVEQGSVSGRRTVSSMTRNLTKRIAATKSFTSTLKKLRALGLDDVTMRQLIADFQSTGSTKAAEALLKGGKSAVGTVSSLQKQLDSAASSLGSYSSKQLYNAGIDAAKGIVKGLESQEKRLDKTATRLGKSIARAVKKALKIKSPSRVMMELGSFAGEGAVLGVEQWIKPMERVSTELTDPLTSALGAELATAPTVAAAGGAASATGGSGTAIIIQEGAIVVQGAGDPALVAKQVLDRLADQIGLGGV